MKEDLANNVESGIRGNCLENRRSSLETDQDSLALILDDDEEDGNEKSAVSIGKDVEITLETCGLPDSVVRQYRNAGIGKMFEWQSKCLGLKNVRDGGNLVYSAPTSAGKTLVAEILMISRVVRMKKKAIMIFPFVSIAREKMFSLKRLLRDVPVRVGGFMGNLHPGGGFKAVDIAVCTIEKANSLVNRLLEEGSLANLGIVVVDELHLIGDPSRGYLLELLLTKIRYFSSVKKDQSVQIVGMSATLPNLPLLSTWLGAELFKTDFRPVPLAEHIKVGNDLYDNTFAKIRTIQPVVRIENDGDHLVYLSLETVLNGHSVLIFCPTKNWCERLAQTVSKEFFALGKPAPDSGGSARVRSQLQSQLDGKRLGEVLEQLRRCPAGLDRSLAKCVSFGVAYHHAGLSMDERDIIEGAFKACTVRVLVATSTLSSGVNLPARRVIIRSPFTFSNNLLDTLSYRQMIGRAGRKGVDTEGESILMCRSTGGEKEKVASLVSAKLAPVKSCLARATDDTLCSSMKRAILEVIVSGIATTPEQVELYASCTLLAKDSEVSSSTIRNCVTFLEDNEFVRAQKMDDESLRYVATQLGLACLASSLSPDEGLAVFDELGKARKCFVLENELHIIYQVVPIYAAVAWPNLDWANYLNIWESLSPDMQRVGHLVGVEERFLVRAMRGTISKESRLLATHQRFYTALALHDLVNEVSLPAVSQKYDASKGMLQSLQQAAASFAAMVTAFCGKLGWGCLQLLIGQFGDRLEFGVQRELIDLCRVSGINGQRARLLFNAGIETAAQLAHSCPQDIENVLQNAAPFESAKSEPDRKNMRSLFLTGQKGVTLAEAAKGMVEEAREVVQADMGGAVIVEWGSEAVLPNVSSAHKSRANKSANRSKNVSNINTSKTKKRRGRRRRTNMDASFDISAQIENVFEAESPSKRLKTEPQIKSEPKTVPKVLTEVKNPAAPPKICIVKEDPLKVDNPAKPKRRSSCNKNNDNDDAFGDSFLDNSALDELDTAAGRSTPKTPMFAACKENLKFDSRKSSASKSRLRCRASKVSPGLIFSDSDDDEDEKANKNELRIVDVCSGRTEFEKFTKKLKTSSSMAICLGCSRRPEDKQLQVDGVAFSFQNLDVHYMQLIGAPDDSIRMDEKMDAINLALKLDVTVCDLKCFLRICHVHLSTDPGPNCRFSDPFVAAWLCNGEMSSLSALARENAPHMAKIQDKLGPATGTGSAAMSISGPRATSARQKASAEVILARTLMEIFAEKLRKANMESSFREVEMPSVICLARMELNGFGFCLEECDRQRKVLLSRMQELEEEAHKLSGRKFSLNSPTDVSRVIFRDLRLAQPQGKKSSCSKEILLKLSKDHKLPGIIIEWRKLNSAISHVVFPMIRAAVRHVELDMARIYPVCHTFTETGRVTLHEPNIQNVPKDFQLTAGPELIEKALGRDAINVSWMANKSRDLMEPYESLLADDGDTFSVSLRRAFVPSDGSLIVSADYSQLELRILAHLSGDQQLCRMLGPEQSDAFKCIAASWKGKSTAEISAVERQQAKQICYGILYGIGSRSLGQLLEIDEVEAADFMAAFMRAFPGVQLFIDATIEKCRENGFVETILKRKRWLPKINSNNPAAKSKAERQAVNSTVQGSAADLAKKAMVMIERRLACEFDSARPLKQSHATSPAHFILQLHDELFYEVRCQDVLKVSNVVRNCMESAIKLSIPTPVCVKVGPSWGELRPFLSNVIDK